MDKMIQLFEDFLLKALEQTEAMLAKEALEQDLQLENFTSNRDRLFLVIEQIASNIDWTKVDEEKKTNFNRLIEFIKALDDKLLLRLNEYRARLKIEIETTCRQKDNVKGYNLNDVK